MDYTQSNAFATHAGTGNRMHNASQATPTAVSDADLNGPAWELVSLIKQAGITPAGFDANAPATYQQVAAAIAALQRQQTNTAYTTAGTAPAFTVTLPASAVALAALGTNLRLRLKFHAAGSGSDTLNIAGLGAKSLKQYGPTGTKVGGVIAAGQLVDVEYDGTDFVLLDPLPPSSTQVNSDWNATSGVAQVLNKPSIPVVPSNVSAFSNDAGYLTSAPFANSLLANGYQKLQGGLIIQWGYVASTGSGTVSVSYPIAFPNVCLHVSTQIRNTAQDYQSIATDAPSRTAFNFYWANDGVGVYWMAIGY